MNDKDRLISQLKKYFPKRVFQRLKEKRDSSVLEGERRRVTILFGDLTGFTALTEKLKDPEKIVKIINKYFSRMVEIIEKYGGDVDKLVGDALMVIFGAPVAHKDDSLRAVNCAIEMIEAVRELGSIKADGKIIDVNMSIGINTGEVVALNMGSDRRMEYTVMGDNVNLASRLEGQASPGEIIISESTHSEIMEKIKCKKLPPVQLKGKEKRVNLYKVLGKEEKKEKDKHFVPFVDRTGEIKTIRKYIRNIDENKIERINIYGPFGTGKTRLLDRIIIKEKGLRCIHIKCNDFIPDIPFYSIIRWIDSEYGKNRPPELEGFFTQENESGNFKESLRGWKEFLRRITHVSPVIIRIEDYNLLEESSMNLLTETADIKGLVIISENIEKIKNYKNIELKNFTRNSVREYVSKSLGGNISSELLNFIHQNSSGNPYRIKIILQWMKSKGLYGKVGSSIDIKGDIEEYPEDLNSLMIEKLDTFPENLREFIKNVSVFGNLFHRNDVLNILDISEFELDELSEIAIEKNILEEDDNTLSFSSPAFREAVYNSVLKEKRSKLHSEIARRMEKSREEDLKKWHSIIAYHFEHGGNKEESAHYYLRAGSTARRNGEYQKALKYYRKSAKYFEQLSNSEKLAEVKMLTGLTYERQRRFKKAGEELETALELAERYASGDNLTADIYTLMAGVSKNTGDLVRAERYYRDAQKIYRKTDNLEGISASYQNLSKLYLDKNEYEKALELYDRTEKIALESDRMDVVSDIYHNRGFIYDITGDTDRAKKSYEKAIDIKKYLKDSEGRAKILMDMGIMHLKSGKYEIAEGLLREANSIFYRTANIKSQGQCKINLGILYSYKGDFKKAFVEYNNALEDLKESGSTKIYDVIANIAEIYEMKGDIEKSSEKYREALKGFEVINDLYSQSYVLIRLGRLNLWQGYFGEALDKFIEGREKASNIGIYDLEFDAVQFITRTKIRMGIIGEGRKEFSSMNPEKIRNHEIKGRYLLTKSLLEESAGEIEKAEKTGRELLKFGKETDSKGIILDAYGTLMKLNVAKRKNAENILEKIKDIMQEDIFKVRNLWIRLSIAKYHLNNGNRKKAIENAKKVLEEAEKSRLRLQALESLIFLGSIYREEDEDSSLLYFQKAFDCLQEMTDSRDEKTGESLMRKYLEVPLAILHFYLKRDNTPMVIEYAKKIHPDILSDILENFKNDFPEALDNFKNRFN